MSGQQKNRPPKKSPGIAPGPKEPIDLSRVEFHRHGMALIPQPGDRGPGMALIRGPGMEAGDPVLLVPCLKIPDMPASDGAFKNLEVVQPRERSEIPLGGFQEEPVASSCTNSG